jgi:uridine kinase
VDVKIQGIARPVPVGTSVKHLLPERMQGQRVVAALIDHKGVSLTTPITCRCTVSALTTAHWEGQRVLRDSLALLALEAGRRLEPPVRLETGPSIGFAQRIEFFDPGRRDVATLAHDLERAMRVLVEQRLDLREEFWAVDEAREHFHEQGSPVAALLRTWRDPTVALVSFGEVYALQMGPILPETGLLDGFHVLPGGDVLLLAYGAEGAALPVASTMFPMPRVGVPAVPGDGASSTDRVEETENAFIERQARRASAHVASLVVDQRRWLEALAVTSVGALNEACIDGNVAQLIRVSEGLHEKRIGMIADEIRNRGDRARVVCIAGPSSSGKTTFIQRLEVQLQVNGLQPVRLSLDDYYVDRVRTPRDDSGEYDYEALEALRLDLLDDHLNRLLTGQVVKTARFAFDVGLSHPEGGRELELGHGQVLLLEGIHGLNPRLFPTVSDEHVYRLFCCPLAQLPFDSLSRVHASDVRLIRRIVRDRHSRGATAAETIQRWPSVRAGERRHIFPFQHHAAAVFDSSLIYELNVLRVFAERYLLEVPQDHPAYTTAFRLMVLLDRFVTIYPDHVPPTSIAREFIGGSGFRY